MNALPNPLQELAEKIANVTAFPPAFLGTAAQIKAKHAELILPILTASVGTLLQAERAAMLYPLPCGHAQFDWIDGKVSPIMHIAGDQPYCRVCAIVAAVVQRETAWEKTRYASLQFNYDDLLKQRDDLIGDCKSLVKSMEDLKELLRRASSMMASEVAENDSSYVALRADIQRAVKVPCNQDVELSDKSGQLQ